MRQVLLTSWETIKATVLDWYIVFTRLLKFPQTHLKKGNDSFLRSPVPVNWIWSHKFNDKFIKKIRQKRLNGRAWSMLISIGNSSLDEDKPCEGSILQQKNLLYNNPKVVSLIVCALLCRVGKIWEKLNLLLSRF